MLLGQLYSLMDLMKENIYNHELRRQIHDGIWSYDEETRIDQLTTHDKKTSK